MLALKRPLGDINARLGGESHYWGLLGRSWLATVGSWGLLARSWVLLAGSWSLLGRIWVRASVVLGGHRVLGGCVCVCVCVFGRLATNFLSFFVSVLGSILEPS